MSSQESTSRALAEVRSDDDHIAYTQGLRHQLIEDMTEKGASLPKDPEAQTILLRALADMDRTALSNKKIGSKERTAAADREAALIAARVIGNLGFKSPFERPIEGTATPTQSPELKDGDLPEIELVPGETEVGVSTMGYDEFMSRMEKESEENESV